MASVDIVVSVKTASINEAMCFTNFECFPVVKNTVGAQCQMEKTSFKGGHCS